MHPVLRIGTVAAIAASLCAVAGPAEAEDRLSVGFGFGYKIDANRLGQTISTDGLDAAAPTMTFFPDYFEGAGDPVPEVAFLDQSVIYAENTLVVYEDLGLISDLEQGGAMVAFDLHLNLRYDFLDVLFARIGFNYSFKGIGGTTKWKSPLGDHLQEWDYTAIGIPLHVGVNVPIADGRFNAYAGVGVAWGSGGFTLKLQAPAGWYTVAANVSDIDPSASPFEGNPGGSSSLRAAAAGAIDEEASIEGSAIGLGYLVGVDGEVIPDLNIFIEAETQYVAKMSEAVAFSDIDSAKVFGAPKLAYPAIPGGQIIRLGVKYTFMEL